MRVEGFLVAQHRRQRCAGEWQLRIQFRDLAQLAQRRQLVEAFQSEVIEEGASGAQQFGFARYVAVADHANPFALFQGLDQVAVDRHAADLFDLATGDRLAIGDQCQRFQGGARVSGLAFGPQPGDPWLQIGAHLIAEAGSDLDQLHPARSAILAQLLQRLFDRAGRGGGVVGKQCG